MRMLRTSHYKVRSHLTSYGFINCYDLECLLAKDYSEAEIMKIGNGSRGEGFRRIKRKLAHIITASGLNAAYIYWGIKLVHLEESK
jgi:hypothetical protein